MRMKLPFWSTKDAKKHEGNPGNPGSMSKFDLVVRLRVGQNLLRVLRG
jgi:hypothetical protein